jgi:hypothetical protein
VPVACDDWAAMVLALMNVLSSYGDGVYEVLAGGVELVARLCDWSVAAWR